MNEWLEEAAARIAGVVGEEPGDYVLTEVEATSLLDLARVVARNSGDRTNAPLLAYLVGLAHGRSPETELDELARRAAES